MSLQKYVRQVRPRTESHISHVDKIQNLFLISEGKGGLEYEDNVLTTMLTYQQQTGIPDFFGLSASSGSAGYSAQGAGDIEAKVYGKTFNIEAKQNKKAQLGSGKIFIPGSGLARASKGFTEKTSEDDLAFILAAANDGAYRKNVTNYLQKLNNLLPIKSTVKMDGVVFTPQEISTYQSYNNHITTGLVGQAVPHIASMVLKSDGLQAKLGMKVPLKAKTIADFYNNKGVYYIQIGGSGLYHLNIDQLDLGTPAFTGEINIEIRIKPDGDSGGYSTSKSFTNAMRKSGGQEFVDKLLIVQDKILSGKARVTLDARDKKAWINAVQKNKDANANKRIMETFGVKLKYPTDILQTRTRPVYASGRFTGELTKSGYTLDTIEGLEKLFPIDEE